MNQRDKLLDFPHSVDFVPEESSSSDRAHTFNGIPSDEFYKRIIGQQSISTSENSFYCDTCQILVENNNISEHEKSLSHRASCRPTIPSPSLYSLNRHNVGYRLLEEHGWSSQTGLGIKKQGRHLPIPTRLKKDRHGIGSEDVSFTSEKNISNNHQNINEITQQPSRKTRNEIIAEQDAEKLKRLQLMAYMNESADLSAYFSKKE